MREFSFVLVSSVDHDDLCFQMGAIFYRLRFLPHHQVGQSDPQ